GIPRRGCGRNARRDSRSAGGSGSHDLRSICPAWAKTHVSPARQIADDGAGTASSRISGEATEREDNRFLKAGDLAGGYDPLVLSRVDRARHAGGFLKRTPSHRPECRLLIACRSKNAAALPG